MDLDYWHSVGFQRDRAQLFEHLDRLTRAVDRVASAVEPEQSLRREVTDVLSALVEFYVDKAGGLTCIEADMLDALYRRVGLEQAADVIARAHAEHDDEGDEHYIPKGAE